MHSKKNWQSETETLLNSKPCEDEKALLLELGFPIKSSTRRTVLLASLYKKAVGGDLSALRELRAMADTMNGNKALEAVKIIDDIRH